MCIPFAFSRTWCLDGYKKKTLAATFVKPLLRNVLANGSCARFNHWGRILGNTERGLPPENHTGLKRPNSDFRKAFQLKNNSSEEHKTTSKFPICMETG